MATEINDVNTIQIRNASNGDYDLKFSSGGSNIPKLEITIEDISTRQNSFTFEQGNPLISSIFDDYQIKYDLANGFNRGIYVKDVKIMLNERVYNVSLGDYTESGWSEHSILAVCSDVELTTARYFVVGQYIYELFLDAQGEVTSIKLWSGSFEIRMTSSLSITAKQTTFLCSADYNLSKTRIKIVFNLTDEDNISDTTSHLTIYCGSDVRVAGESICFFAGGAILVHNPGTSSLSLSNNQRVATIVR